MSELNSKRGQRKKLEIPANAHPLEVFMITKEFAMGELESITGISKKVLVSFINGGTPTEEQQKRIRLTTGVIL